MGTEESMPWSGPEFLARVGGTAAEFSPARVLFLVQRLKASGRLWLTQGADIRTLDLADGAVVGCSGFPDLLCELNVAGERMDGLDHLIGQAVEAGNGPDEALRIAAQELGRFIVASEGQAELMIQFAPGAPGPAQPVTLPCTPVELVAGAISHGNFFVETRAWVLVEGGASPVVSRPIDAPEENWGLSASALELLTSAEQVNEMRAVPVEGDVQWAEFALLRILGLLGVGSEQPADQQAAAQPASPVLESAAAIVDAAEEPADDTTAARMRFDRPHTPGSSAKRPKERQARRRRKLSRAEVLGRNPWEGQGEQVEDDLKLAYEVLGACRPEAALLIRKTDDLVIDIIEQRYREACARYHPDRYLGSNQAICALAEGCFGRVSDAYHLLKDPAHHESARERLVFKETGKRPVNDKTRARSRVHFKQAEMLFRQRRYEDAGKLAQRAEDGDPARWEYRYLRLRAQWRGGSMATEDVVQGITQLEGMGSPERAEAMYIAGEMLLKDGRQKEAFSLFKQAVGVDPENVGARRRLRLAENRKAKEQSKPTRSGKKDDSKKGGRPLFGGLFGRRGD